MQHCKYQATGELQCHQGGDAGGTARSVEKFAELEQEQHRGWGARINARPPSPPPRGGGRRRESYREEKPPAPSVNAEEFAEGWGVKGLVSAMGGGGARQREFFDAGSEHTAGDAMQRAYFGNNM
jgi:hypothetical protein